jgi:hypothetical protein
VFSDALDREAAWLNTTGDTLPTLPATAGGPFQIVQARWPRVAATRKTGLYVLRNPTSSFHVDRFSSQRSMLTTTFLLRLLWPLTSGQGSAEADQLAFEQAIDQVLTRVEGPLLDKTHGGRFLSIAESRVGITVHYDDPEKAVGNGAGIFTARITYAGDDPEIVN